ncbi:hypothetical protein HDU83_000030 [Entophlyctis luteolus]|nr:hypothetical protein HDU83_000030 [Entophlyctis luteolus]
MPLPPILLLLLPLLAHVRRVDAVFLGEAMYGHYANGMTAAAAAQCNSTTTANSTCADIAKSAAISSVAFQEFNPWLDCSNGAVVPAGSYVCLADVQYDVSVRSNTASTSGASFATAATSSPVISAAGSTSVGTSHSTYSSYTDTPDSSTTSSGNVTSDFLISTDAPGNNFSAISSADTTMPVSTITSFYPPTTTTTTTATSVTFDSSTAIVISSTSIVISSPSIVTSSDVLPETTTTTSTTTTSTTTTTTETEAPNAPITSPTSKAATSSATSTTTTTSSTTTTTATSTIPPAARTTTTTTTTTTSSTTTTTTAAAAKSSASSSSATVLISGSGDGSFYYDVSGNSCPSAKTFAENNGYTSCEPSVGYETLEERGTNYIVALAKDEMDSNKAGLCGKRVQVYYNGVAVDATFYVWDSCVACEGGVRLDFSLTALMSINSNVCNLGIVSGISWQVLDEQVVPYVQ